MKRALIYFIFVLMIALVLVLPVDSSGKQPIALITINNYSGVDSVGGNMIENLVAEEFV